MRWERCGTVWRSKCGRYELADVELSEPRTFRWKGRRYSAGNVITVVRFFDGVRTVELGCASNAWDGQEWCAQHARLREGQSVNVQIQTPPQWLRELADRLERTRGSMDPRELVDIAAELFALAGRLVRLAQRIEGAKPKGGPDVH